MKRIFSLVALLCLAGCGIKGDLVRPSEIGQPKQKKENDGFLSLPQ